MDTWQELLDKRGLLTAATEASWQFYHLVTQDQGEHDGWCYPVWDLDEKPFMTERGQRVVRWKNFDSHVHPKYWWPRSNHGAKYYVLPGTKQAILDAGGSVYLASGEPDNLVFRAAGQKNVLSWYGENAFPKDLIAVLRTLCVTSVECWPDLDKSGQGWAENIHEALAGSDIIFHAYSLPNALGEKGDINKLWMFLSFNKPGFWDTLVSCSEMEFKAKPSQPKPVLLFAKRNEGDDLPDGFIAAIESRLGISSYKPNGFSKEIPCPMDTHEHDDKTPSAGWNHEKRILKCFKCAPLDINGKIYLAKEVGSALGLTLAEYYPKTERREYRPEPIDAEVKSDTPKATRSWSSLTTRMFERLEGQHIDTREPLPLPFANLNQFGGLAEELLPGKVIGVAGDSGKGKTSFIETIIDSWRILGFSGTIWSPEWMGEEHIYRAVQRNGGPSVMEFHRHFAYMSGVLKNAPEHLRRGKQFNAATLDMVKIIGQRIDNWNGKLDIVDKMGLDIEQIIENMGVSAIDFRQQGKSLSFAVLDYAQLISTSSGKATERIDKGLALFKAFCVDNKLAGLVTSQVTKQDGRGASSGNNLGQHALQNTRSDYFNLVITISREMDENTGQDSEIADIMISKNSLGRNGACKLAIDGKRMRWGDPIPVNLENY